MPSPVQMPSLQGTIWVVTGANTGIGKITADALARAGAKVVLACRSREKTMPVIEGIVRDSGNPDVHFVPLDLTSLDSVRACAQQLHAELPRIDGLINNAGLAGQRGKTVEGFELAFGVNHLGHFLLTHLVEDLVLASDRARIVNVSSRAHYRAKGMPWEQLRTATPSATGLDEYAVSKLANVLFTAELHRRLGNKGVITASLHPGVVATDVWRSLPGPLEWLIKQFMISPEQGAQTTLHCSVHPELAEKNGLYWDSCKVRRPSRLAQDPALARELWERSAAWTGVSA